MNFVFNVQVVESTRNIGYHLLCNCFSIVSLVKQIIVILKDVECRIEFHVLIHNEEVYWVLKDLNEEPSGVFFKFF